MGHESYSPLGKVSVSGAGRTKDDLWSMYMTSSTRGGSKIHHPLLRAFSPSDMPAKPPSITTRITIWTRHEIIEREYSAPKIGLGDTLLLERKDGKLFGATRGTSKFTYSSPPIPADCDVKIDLTKISDISGNNTIPGKTTYTLQEDESALFEERETGLEFVEEKGRELKVRPVTVYEGGEGWDEGGESTDEALHALAEKPPPSQSNDG